MPHSSSSIWTHCLVAAAAARQWCKRRGTRRLHPPQRLQAPHHGSMALRAAAAWPAAQQLAPRVGQLAAAKVALGAAKRREHRASAAAEAPLLAVAVAAAAAAPLRAATMLGPPAAAVEGLWQKAHKATTRDGPKGTDTCWWCAD